MAKEQLGERVVCIKAHQHEIGHFVVMRIMLQAKLEGLPTTGTIR